MVDVFAFWSGDKKESAKKRLETVTRDYTIHLRKMVFGVQFKKRAPRAVREIRKFAQRAMGTSVGFFKLCVP